MDKGKIILIVGVVLIIVSFAISAIAIMNMNAAISKLNNINNQEIVDETAEPEKIPIEQLIVFFFDDKIISVLPSSEDPTKVVNITFQVGFSLDSKNKKAVDYQTQITEKKDVVINRIAKMIAKKTGEELMATDARERLEREIFDLMSLEFDSEPLVEVYVKNLLYSIR